MFWRIIWSAPINKFVRLFVDIYELTRYNNLLTELVNHRDTISSDIQGYE